MKRLLNRWDRGGWVVGGWVTGTRAASNPSYRVGRLILALLALVLLSTGCEPVNTALETRQTEADSNLARSQAEADAARVQAAADAEAKRRTSEAEAEAAVIAAEAQALEAQAAADEAQAATTEALANLEQAQGDRSLKESVASQVDSITTVLKATTETLQALTFGVLALLVIFALGVVGFIYLGWRGQQEATQAPRPRYIMVQEQRALDQDRGSVLMPAKLRPIEHSVRAGRRVNWQ